jgi:Fic family protein
MLSYLIGPGTTRLLKDLFGQTRQYYELLNSFAGPKKAYIRKSSLISNIGASTRIENAILTDMEIDWIDTEISSQDKSNYKKKERIIKNKLSKDKERSIEEVAGYREALQIIDISARELFPLREADIKGLHRELMKYYSGAGHHLGNYKTQVNSVVETNNATGIKRMLLQTADPGLATQTSMHDLVQWFNKTVQEDPWCLPSAVEFIFRFLAIHPFQDGNGRLSRLLFQMLLMQADDRYFSEVIPYIALDRAIEKTRTQYYLVLQKCADGKFDPDPRKYEYIHLLDYMIRKIRESLSHIDHYAKKYDQLQGLTETDLNILHCFKDLPEQYLQTKDLLAMLKIPRRTIGYSLNKLLTSEFIQAIGRGPGVKYKIVF